jgi:ribonuclease-3
MPKKRPIKAREERLRRVCERIGYDFEDLSLLDRALCHSSLGNQGLPNYERLEFLGDAVLGFLVAENLYRHDPEIPEGDLTSCRSLMVSRQPLSEIGGEMRLGDDLMVGRGLSEESRRAPRILADRVEAVLAAVDLDGGLDAARRFVQRHVVDRLEVDVQSIRTSTDAKTKLNQWAQSRALLGPIYTIDEVTGPDHDPTFRVSVQIGEVTATSPAVKSKQHGEQAAAAKAHALIRARAQAPSDPTDPSEGGSVDRADDTVPLVWEDPDKDGMVATDGGTE